MLPVICKKVLSFLVQMSVHNINKGRGPLEVLEVYIPQDPSVDNDMVLDIVIRHRDASIPDLPFCNSHPEIQRMRFLHHFNPET